MALHGRDDPEGSMLVALALTAALHAAEVVPEVRAEPTPQAALATAEALAEDGEDTAAAATLEWVLEQDAPPHLHQQAAELLETLETLEPRAAVVSRRPWGARTRLVGWEAAVGGTLGGSLGYYPAVEGDAPALLPIGILAGGVLGAFSPRFFEQWFPITPATTTTLVLSQQLLMFDLAAASYLVDEWGEAVPAGLLIGGLLGTVGGVVFASQGPEDGPAAAAHAGAFWGIGFAVAGLTVGYAWDADVTVGTLVAGANLGVLGGWALGRYAGLSREEVRMANYGAAFGAGAAYAFGWATEDSILWTDGGVAVLLTAGAVIGGVGGALVVRRYSDRGSPLAGLELLPPAPAATPGGGPALALVNARF